MGKPLVVRYALASQFWRAIPAWWADRAWQRRGERLLRQAARAVPACSTLLRAFAQPQPGVGVHTPSAPQGAALKPTSWRSYVEVFSAEQRSRQGWQRQLATYEPLDRRGLPTGGWPRSSDEVRTLREQLVGLLAGWFDARQRRTLLLVDLPAGGWRAGRRIAQALQEAIGLGHLRAGLVDMTIDARHSDWTASRLAGQFDQCVLLCRAEDAARQGQRVIGWSGRAGLLAFGLLPAVQRATLPAELTVCSTWGIDEVGPLIGLETPLSRLICNACGAQGPFRQALLPGSATIAGVYQPFPIGPWIEQHGAEVLVSSWGAAPIVRYGFQQRGRVLLFGEVCQLLRRHEVQSPRGIRGLMRIGSVCWKLPVFVLFHI